MGLKSFLTILQPYHGGQFYCWLKMGSTKVTTDLHNGNYFHGHVELKKLLLDNQRNLDPNPIIHVDGLKAQVG